MNDVPSKFTADRPRRDRASGGSLLRHPALASFAFSAFLIVTQIGLKPQALFGTIEGQLSVTQGGEGDMLKQVVYVVLCVLVMLINIVRNPRSVPVKLPLTMAIFAGWAWVSLCWSGFPDVGLRRLILMTIVLVTAFSVVQSIGSKRALTILATVSACILIANLAAVAVLPGAIEQHDPFDMTSEAVATWRGLMIEKNGAGAVAAIQALIFMSIACSPGLRSGKRILWAVLLALDIVFVLGTGSKTSILILLPAGLLAAGLTLISGNRLAAAAIVTAIITVVSLCIIVDPAIVSKSAIALRDLLNTPHALTGRVEIWLVALRYIGDNFWLGAGYGSFWSVGFNGPVLRYTTGWILLQPNAHNGYLDLMLQLGVVGLILGVIAAFAVPLYNGIARPGIPAHARWLILSVILFVTFHNFLEATYFNRDNPSWVLFVVVVAILRSYPYRIDAVPKRRPRRISVTPDAFNGRFASPRL